MHLFNKIIRIISGRNLPQTLPAGNHIVKTKRAPENVPGDFYVQCDCCVTCGAPEAEGPDLMETGSNGCYFKRQPITDEEVEQAINAIAVSCVAAVRYGGKDKKIIEKLYEIGCGSECDHQAD